VPITIVVHGNNVTKYNKLREKYEEKYGKGSTQNVIFGHIIEDFNYLMEETTDLKEYIVKLKVEMAEKDNIIRDALISSVSAPKFFGVQSSPQINTNLGGYAPPLPNSPPPPPMLSKRVEITLDVATEYDDPKGELRAISEPTDGHLLPSDRWKSVRGDDYEAPDMMPEVKTKIKQDPNNPFYKARQESAEEIAARVEAGEVTKAEIDKIEEKREKKKKKRKAKKEKKK